MSEIIVCMTVGFPGKKEVIGSHETKQEISWPKAKIIQGIEEDLVTQQTAPCFTPPGGHLSVLLLNAEKDVIVELVQGFNVGHFLAFQLEAVILFNNDHNIDKVETIDANLFPCGIWFNYPPLDLEFVDQKSIYVLYDIFPSHEEIYNHHFEGSKDRKNYLNFRTMSVEFVPPKPNALERKVSKPLARVWLVMLSFAENSSGLSKLIFGAMKSFCIIRIE